MVSFIKISKKGFCINCGASYFYKVVNSGILKKLTKLKTNANIFIKGKMDYYKLDSKLPKFYKHLK